LLLQLLSRGKIQQPSPWYTTVQLLAKDTDLRFPFPLGNILGGGAHAGPGTPAFKRILNLCQGSKTVNDAIEVNFCSTQRTKESSSKNDPDLLMDVVMRRWAP